MKPIEEKLVFDTSNPDDSLVLESAHFGLQHASLITGGELIEEAEVLKTRLEHKEEQDIFKLSVREARLALGAMYLRREFAIVHDCIGDGDLAVMRHRGDIEAFAGETVPVTVH